MKTALKSMAVVICLTFLVMNLSPLRAQNAGVGFATVTVIEKVVGEEVTFTITARDNTGDIIRGWNNTGTDVTLVVSNSGANTDNEPLTETVIKDKDGNPLQKQGPDTFILPRTLFVDGVTQVTFVTTKADTGIFITASPALAGLKNISATMNYRADVIENFLVELIPSKLPNIVYVYRRYEIRVTPRDRYNNINAFETIITKFTARHPGEFVNKQLGSADIFAGEVFIQGVSNYFVISSQVRTDQSITAYKSVDVAVRGTTGPYEIAEHAPAAFSLLSPPDNTEIFIDYALQREDLTWQNAADPYTNILVGGQMYSDEVKYAWHASSLSGAPLMSLGSNNFQKDAKLSLSGSQLTDIITQTTGTSTSKSTVILWHAAASDGLFTTLSTETWRLTITKRGITDVKAEHVPGTFSLSQNFPNPFNPSTSITFEIPTNEFVSLKIFDLLGNEITTLVQKNLEAGSHTIVFEADEIPAGIYVYKLKAGSRTATRKMTLVK